MRPITICLLTLLVMVAVAPAGDKPTVSTVAPPPDPGVIRQGGDTLQDSILLEIPADITGTVVGYTDDYDEACPYPDSTSPDVVYRLTPPYDMEVDIDMLGSFYDTKIYVYGPDHELLACNDDFYPDYTSRIEQLPLAAGRKYFLVIDGYGGDAGDYQLRVDIYEPFQLDCPIGADLENEPPLADGYEDMQNSGCDRPEFGAPMGSFFDYLCARSGWYHDAEGTPCRDTDWYEFTIDSFGFLEVLFLSEQPLTVREMGPTDCNEVGVIQELELDPGEEGLLTVVGPTGTTVWVWFGPTEIHDTVEEFDYQILLNLPVEPPVATEARSWSAVKGLFD